MEAFIGKYEMTYAEASGGNYFLAIAYEIMITKEVDIWTIKTSTTLNTTELKFKLDEKFDETTPEGRDVETIVKFENNKLVTVQKAKESGEKTEKMTGELVGDELVFTTTIDGVDDFLCIQKFKRV